MESTKLLVFIFSIKLFAHIDLFTFITNGFRAQNEAE